MQAHGAVMSICVKLPSITDKEFVVSMGKECARFAVEGSPLLARTMKKMRKNLPA
jgi:formiminotetrahydrofolate cyclodeaminase